MTKEFYCPVCERTTYQDYWTHRNSYNHQLKMKQKSAQVKAEKEKQQKENDFACLLASALEGYTINPGDEVSLRDGRSFKADIHGTLFEIPTGS